ncbi:MAG: Gfo/Idh/MocA family oxidoreductase [Planctomycetaceae bacterium]
MPHSPLRIGFVSLDSSHCTAFTRLLQQASADPADPWGLAGAAITAGWPGGSPEFPLSRDRVDGFTAEMQSLGVQIVSTVEEVLQQVDAVILGAVDGRQHEELAARIFPAGLPVFIDKPLAHDYPAACRVAAVASQCGTPWFTASALRFQHALTSTLSELQLDKQHITGCDAWGTLRTGVGHLELAWYGIHGIEALYAVMGTGCQTVTRHRTESGDLTTGIWPNGRIGTFRALHEGVQPPGFGMTIFGSHTIRSLHFPATYHELLAAILQFFRSRRPPVTNTESNEIFAFMHAAEISSHQSGQTISLIKHMSCR